MGSMSIWHWLVFVIFYLIFGIPAARILRRMGYSGWWSVIAVIPLANIIGLWVLAFIDWPISRERPVDRAA